MIKLFKYLIIINIFTFVFSGCWVNNKKKWLNFENGDYKAEIVIVDKKNNKNKFIIKPEYINGWSEAILGDFHYIFIKAENDLEGIFIVTNEYKERGNFQINIKIVDNVFELEYDIDNLNIIGYYNYDENYFEMKKKFFIDYN